MEWNTEYQIAAQNVKSHREVWMRLYENTVKVFSLPEENVDTFHSGRSMWTVIEKKMKFLPHGKEKEISELHLGNFLQRAKCLQAKDSEHFHGDLLVISTRKFPKLELII